MRFSPGLEGRKRIPKPRVAGSIPVVRSSISRGFSVVLVAWEPLRPILCQRYVSVEAGQEQPLARLVALRLGERLRVMRRPGREEWPVRRAASTGSTTPRRPASEQNERRRSCGLTLPSPAASPAAATARAAFRCRTGRPERVTNTKPLSAPRPRRCSRSRSSTSTRSTGGISGTIRAEQVEAMKTWWISRASASRCRGSASASVPARP
jgi:hypothetical protein